jgi:hypothetical protein
MKMDLASKKNLVAQKGPALPNVLTTFLLLGPLFDGAIDLHHFSCLFVNFKN